MPTQKSQKSTRNKSTQTKDTVKTTLTQCTCSKSNRILPIHYPTGMNNNQFEDQSVDSGTEHSPISNSNFDHKAVNCFETMEPYQMEPVTIMSHAGVGEMPKLLNPAINPHMNPAGQQSPHQNHQINHQVC